MLAKYMDYQRRAQGHKRRGTPRWKFKLIIEMLNDPDHTWTLDEIATCLGLCMRVVRQGFKRDQEQKRNARQAVQRAREERQRQEELAARLAQNGKLPKIVPGKCTHWVTGEDGKLRQCGAPTRSVHSSVCQEHYEAQMPKHGLAWAGRVKVGAAA